MSGRIAYYGNIVTSGLVFDFDAAKIDSYAKSGTSWKDISKNNIGTLTNGPTYNSDNFGSIVFDGTNDYTSTTGITLGTNSTIQCTFKLTTLSSPETIFNIFSGKYLDPYWYASTVSAGGALWWYVLSDGWIMTSNGLVSANTWYNLAARISGRNHRYYLNGSLVLNYTATSDPGSSGLGDIGRITGLNSRFMPGQVSQILGYNRALTDAEITQNFNAIRGRYGI